MSKLSEENKDLKQQIAEMKIQMMQMQQGKDLAQIEKEDKARSTKKKKYYKVVCQNRDMADGEPDYIDFFANDKRVIIKPGLETLISSTAYENLTKRSIQTRWKTTPDKLSEEPLQKYLYERFPVITLGEYELTEDEYNEMKVEVEKEALKKLNEKVKEVA